MLVNVMEIVFLFLAKAMDMRMVAELILNNSFGLRNRINQNMLFRQILIKGLALINYLVRLLHVLEVQVGHQQIDATVNSGNKFGMKANRLSAYTTMAKDQRLNDFMSYKR